MISENTRRALSVRLPPALMESYSNLIEGAGLKISENIRCHVQKLTDLAAALEAEPVGVDIKFQWRSQLNNPYPESVGALSVAISPPAGMTQNDVDRIIFVSPEFFGERGSEPFRVDSYYYHRVANSMNLVDSSRVNRHVLSFVTIEGRWHAGVYRYNDSLTLSDLAKAVEAAVVKQITSTIRCFQLGLLPNKRLLDADQIAKRRESLGNIDLPDEASFSSV